MRVRVSSFAELHRDGGPAVSSRRSGDAAGATHGEVLIGVLADPSPRLLAQYVS